MKKNNKTGKTFTEKKQIMAILNLSKCDENRWMTTREIVDVANVMGWTTPMDDTNRLAASHPYSKILSMMTDVTNDSYYTNGVLWRKGTGKWKKIEYRLT